jgi:hypothetical protein
MYIDTGKIPDIFGDGKYPGEIRQGSDGLFYRWVERREGFGGTVGFWDLVRRAGGWLRARLAQNILNNPNVNLANRHVSGVNDNATARRNIDDTANGRPASRSSYGNAPGGTITLNIRLLGSILKLAQTYNFHISELAGGSHSANSRHYAGITMDVNVINGQHVSGAHPDFRNFMRACRALGATEVLGPGNKGHATHIHCAWPRP